jgi:hypothetical protein
MAPIRLWRVIAPQSPEWRETFLRLAAATEEGRGLSPTFDGSLLSFNASAPQDRGALRLVKDLMVQTNFSVEHQACGAMKTYVGDTRMSMTCACGAEIVRRLDS